METKVTGVVQAVGTQFNGSLKVNEKFYNFPKKYDGRKDFNVGDNIVIQLRKWEFGGKSGYNIGSVELASSPVITTVEVVTPNPKPPVPQPVVAPKGRDFDKEARGKTLCQYIQAQLSNSSVDVNDLNAIMERAKTLMERTFAD